MANITKDKYGIYHYIGVTDAQYQHNSLILDSNVAINTEKFFYNPNKLNHKLNATRDFLIENIDSDLLSGFAIQESCWDYMLEGINKGQFDKLECALNNVFNWDEKQIIKHTSSIGSIYEGKVSREKVSNILSLVPQIKECNPLMLGSYACILKIMIIQKEKTSKIESVKAFIDFLTHELNTLHALEMQLAINYFLGKDELYAISNGIFKFDKQNGEILLKAWNATWDIFFLRILQRAYSDYNFLKLENPRLVTADKSLIGIAELCSLEGSISNEDHFVPIISFDESLIKEEFKGIVEKINNDIKDSYLKRYNARESIEDKEEFLIEKIKTLETELLKR